MRPPAATAGGTPRLRARLAALAALPALVSCAGPPGTDAPCPPGTDRLGEYRLFLGRAGPDGTDVVGDGDWQAFLREVVTPRFPDGLTAQDARGQWRDPQGVIRRERSKVLTLFAGAGPGAMARVGEVAAEYRGRFGQEAVLVSAGTACVTFGM